MLRALVGVLGLTTSGARAAATAPGRRAVLAAAAMSAGASAASAAPADDIKVGGSLVRGDESLMSQKAHGTTESPVQPNLRWSVARDTADKICSFNRHYGKSNAPHAPSALPS